MLQFHRLGGASQSLARVTVRHAREKSSQVTFVGAPGQDRAIPGPAEATQSTKSTGDLLRRFKEMGQSVRNDYREPPILSDTEVTLRVGPSSCTFELHVASRLHCVHIAARRRLHSAASCVPAPLHCSHHRCAGTAQQYQCQRFRTGPLTGSAVTVDLQS